MTTNFSSFPELPSSGENINPKECIERGTSTAILAGGCIAFFVFIILTLSTYGILLLAALFYPLISWYQNRKALALIHGSGIKISEYQFKEIYNCVKVFSERLGMRDVPEVYIVESNILNAFAVKYGKKNVILLTDEIIHATLLANRPQALSYILGHELGHIALKHNGLIKSFITSKYKKLSRLNEYSADSVAKCLIRNRSDGLYGLLILAVGPGLIKYLNPEALIDQINEVNSNKYSNKAEKLLTHPLLLRRIERLQ